VNSPNTLDGNYVEKCNTGAAVFQMEAGTIDFAEEGEENLIEKMRELISILPSNNEDAAEAECDDDLNRLTEGFDTESADPAKALADISDGGLFVEVKKGFAREMVTGFIQLNGATVGAVANRTAILDDDYKAVEKFDGKLTKDGCKKAEDFVAFCDAFNLPIVTLTNVSGYSASVEEEKGIAGAAAKLTYAFANATVPKVNLIVGKAYGSAYITMNSKHIGADLVFALPQAEIAMMDAKSAAKIICDDPAKVAETADEYARLQSSAQAAAKRGYVDSIIDADSVRKHLIYAFEMLYTKSEDRPAKKHGTV
jgi:acetyl-CoA carboxylase carboxyltransferase component